MTRKEAVLSSTTGLGENKKKEWSTLQVGREGGREDNLI
jgi:hypothetical protein